MPIRKSPIAGTWYPASPAALAAAVDRYLDEAERAARADPDGRVVAVVSPHAGLVYSGPVAAHAYRLARTCQFDVAVLVGPSHFVAFDGVAVVPAGGFQTPLGVVYIDEACAADIGRVAPVVRDHQQAHIREHALEMQLPFLQRVAPGLPMVPLLVGHQTAAVARELGEGLAAALEGRRALLVASSDLSHYHDATNAARLDEVVIGRVAQFDPDGLQNALERCPEHACGGGAMVAVMRAARGLGATDARVLHYADSGDVTGDKSAVVGYMAAAFGNFPRDPRAGAS